MKATRIVGSLFVLTALGSLLAAQTPAPKAQPGTPIQKHEAHPMQKEAGARPEAAHEFTFGVTGLTADNLMKAKEGLQGLSNKVFACDACKVEEASAGNCPKCKGALKPTTRTIFSSVTPSVESGTIDLTLEPKAMLRYSELESTLAKDSIRIDPTHFTLPGRTRLLFKGATADMAPIVEKALTDAKLFDEVKARFDTDTNGVVVLVKSGSVVPSRAKVAAALESAKAKLTDIVWGPMTPKS